MCHRIPVLTTVWQFDGQKKNLRSPPPEKEIVHDRLGFELETFATENPLKQ